MKHKAPCSSRGYVQWVAGEWTAEYRRGKVMEMLVKMTAVMVKIAVIVMAPGSALTPPEARGREPPPSSSSLTFSLDGRRVSPRVHGLHGTGGAKAPSRVDLSLCLSLFLRSQILPWHRFFYIRRSVTPIGLKPSPRYFFQKLAFVRPK